MVWSTHNIIWQHIAECPEHIPQLARWFQDEWGLSDRECTLETRCEELSAKIDKNSLPLTMVALARGEPLGTYSLDLTDLDIRPNLSPWLASVFVNPKYRHQGIGTLLVKESLHRWQSNPTLIWNSSCSKNLISPMTSSFPACKTNTI